MERIAITAEVVEAAEQLLAQGVDRKTIAARIGITEYVVRLIAIERNRNGRPQPLSRFATQIPGRHDAVDAATVRMIQRMLAVGILTRRQIAREANVSPWFVSAVASGKRPATDRISYALDPGEQLLPKPIRCKVCGGKISVVPCRLCKARRERESACRA